MVSNICYFHPYLGKWCNLTTIFQMGWNHQLVNCAGLVREFSPKKMSLIQIYEIGWIQRPTQDASHHQDYVTFLVEDSFKPSFATLARWGVDPNYRNLPRFSWTSFSFRIEVTFQELWTILAESREEVQVVMELREMVGWDLVTGCEQWTFMAPGCECCVWGLILYRLGPY